MTTPALEDRVAALERQMARVLLRVPAVPWDALFAALDRAGFDCQVDQIDETVMVWGSFPPPVVAHIYHPHGLHIAFPYDLHESYPSQAFLAWLEKSIDLAGIMTPAEFRNLIETGM